MNDIIVNPQALPAATTDVDFLDRVLERAAGEPQFDLERIAKLLDLRERWERGTALKAFAAAKVAFKSNPPVIGKNKQVSFTNKAGQRTEYMHADHHEVTSKISAALAPHGLSHAWSVTQTGNVITVKCTLTHIAGHSESVELSSLADTSGGKNDIQAVSSTNTYLQRYTLLAVTGLSVGDIDDDGRAAGPPQAPPEVHQDVWTVLNDAAAQGKSALIETWRTLQPATRETIVLHYADAWNEMKKMAEKNGTPHA